MFDKLIHMEEAFRFTIAPTRSFSVKLKTRLCYSEHLGRYPTIPFESVSPFLYLGSSLSVEAVGCAEDCLDMVV